MSHQENHQPPALFVDGDPYPWPDPSITGAQIRTLASIPENVDLFLKVPGHPDKLIENSTILPLGEQKPHLSTQAVGSKGG